MTTTPNLEASFRFLSELSSNNHKAWFEEHRPDYEAARAAFEYFLAGLIEEFHTIDNLGGLTPRQCVARIYRDVRFSHDKTPYKTNFGALIAPGGWKSQTQGYYIGLGPGQTMVAGGLYAPTAEQLERFRRAIDGHAPSFKEILSAPAFIESFGSISGERLKTAPKGYERDHPEIDLLRLKQITVIHQYSDADALLPDFITRAIRDCRAMRPFLDYLLPIQ